MTPPEDGLPSPPGKRILVCALDWGLGHATRTARLVHHWEQSGPSIVLAGNGRSLAFWQSEFPHLAVRELPDYAIRYAPGALLVPRLLASLPRLAKVIRAEHRRIQDWSGEFDAVVSDNRFGCHFPGKRSWFLTHQVHLAAPGPLRALEPLGEQVMAHLLRAFDRILIPDHRDPEKALSGRLGHPVHPSLFPTLQWIGPLSRFENLPPCPSSWSGPWDGVGLISGPEPSRTSFEELLRQRWGRSPGKFLLVRGLPGLPGQSHPMEHTGVQEVPHLGTTDLAASLRGAKEIVTRGGYSTLMDLEALGKLDASVLLVPTPGQTEQETLAVHLEATRGVRWTTERDLSTRPGAAP
ncbi:MAG: hypothetical protein H6686_12825 [Fibrobacteria bacterium]|nr:hypothetical protein [Fibrobacteria bacterium]